MTTFAETAGAALLRAVDDLPAGTAGADRVRALAVTLQQACAYYETHRPVPPHPVEAPPPPTPGLADYQRIADAGGDQLLVARLLHGDGAGLVDRLKVLRAVFDLSLEAARAADDAALP